MQGSTSQNNWPMHMGFQNQQNNSDGFSHQTNNQHKSSGKCFVHCDLCDEKEIQVNFIR